MLIDQVKQDNIQAMKSRNNTRRAIYSIIIGKYSNLEIENKSKGKETTDADLLSIIQKTLKELDDELAGHILLGRQDKIVALEEQKQAIKAYLPKQLTEQEIKVIISNLPDKSLPAVMKHFKTNYAGSVDMSLVGKVARGS